MTVNRAGVYVFDVEFRKMVVLPKASLGLEESDVPI
jgi:hypothetical protein